MIPDKTLHKIIATGASLRFQDACQLANALLPVPSGRQPDDYLRSFIQAAIDYYDPAINQISQQFPDSNMDDLIAARTDEVMQDANERNRFHLGAAVMRAKDNRIPEFFERFKTIINQEKDDTANGLLEVLAELVIENKITPINAVDYFEMTQQSVFINETNNPTMVVEWRTLPQRCADLALNKDQVFNFKQRTDGGNDVDLEIASRARHVLGFVQSN